MSWRIICCIIMRRNIMKKLVVLLVCHSVLLMLASTRFSIISWLWGDVSWQWTYFQFSSRNGWGTEYVSDYSLLQVLCYILAYGLGLVIFGIMRFRTHPIVSVIGVVLCILGTCSFCIEVSHWLWNHHWSLIASCPAAMVVLWICLGVQLAKKEQADQ